LPAPAGPTAPAGSPTVNAAVPLRWPIDDERPGLPLI